MMRTMKAESIGGREVRVRVELDRCGLPEDAPAASMLEGGLIEIVEEYSPGERTRTRPEKIGEVVLTTAEAQFVHGALGEILSDLRPSLADGHPWPSASLLGLVTALTGAGCRVSLEQCAEDGRSRAVAGPPHHWHLRVESTAGPRASASYNRDSLEGVIDVARQDLWFREILGARTEAEKGEQR